MLNLANPAGMLEGKDVIHLKISEFAELNRVTAKMLRHYDEIGLLKPIAIDPKTGYRSYESEQSHQLNWIVILKNLDFPLMEIKTLLSGPVDSVMVIKRLARKRIEIGTLLNEQTQKKIAIDRLITLIEKEGFCMSQKLDLLRLNQSSIHDIKKNIPNMESFLEEARHIAALCTIDDAISMIRFDISHFKSINDSFGFDIGDHVIVVCYQIIEANVQSALSHAAVGRAHGDEFVVFAKASQEHITLVSESIVRDLSAFDFDSIACPRQMGCYIGGLTAAHQDIGDIRQFIEDSIEVIEHARKKGPNSVVIGSYRV